MNIRENVSSVEELLRTTKFYAIDAVDIKPTDIIVLRVLGNTHADNIEYMRLKVKELFPSNQVLVLVNGSDLFVARKEQ